MSKNLKRLTIDAVTQAVQLSTRYSWPVILAFLLVALVSAGYFAPHFAITTDSNKLLASSLPWRHPEIALARAFPWRLDHIIACIDSHTRSGAGDVAEALCH